MKHLTDFKKINGITQKTKYYLGDYEEETDYLGNIKKIHYLSGGAILINTNGVETLYYGYADYQGNLIALANEAGAVVERYAYDPWGKRRNPADWTQDDTRTGWIIDRGYTMHEHLDAFGIINMNGRVYDPLTAMFFSPDPFVQAPGNWLNYNRYAYCYGNPFKYTDPDGEFIFTLICIFVPGMQPFLPIAVATDAAWMSEYASQVTNNYLKSKDMNYTSKDIWFGKIDWFDVGLSGIGGGLSTAFPPAAPWIKYGTPVIKNAVDVTGDGDFETIFGGKNNNRGDGTKSMGMFLVNTLLEVGSIAFTDLAENYFNKTPSNFPKDISRNTPKPNLLEMSKKELLNKTSWDFTSSIMTILSQEGFSLQYDQYQQQKLQNNNKYYLPTSMSPNLYKYNYYFPYNNYIKLSNKTSNNILSINLSTR
ncbi:MAG: RHS repeat-associated core domain-containing protein [Paludibacter sp.]|nr:RHS repeat-associated core domain-containing protein [Paludibacter sp.]